MIYMAKITKYLSVNKITLSELAAAAELNEELVEYILYARPYIRTYVLYKLANAMGLKLYDISINETIADHAKAEQS